jgi:hypothetical protein
MESNKDQEPIPLKDYLCQIKNAIDRHNEMELDALLLSYECGDDYAYPIRWE